MRFLAVLFSFSAKKRVYITIWGSLLSLYLEGEFSVSFGPSAATQDPVYRDKKEPHIHEIFWYSSIDYFRITFAMMQYMAPIEPTVSGKLRGTKQCRRLSCRCHDDVLCRVVHHLTIYMPGCVRLVGPDCLIGCLGYPTNLVNKRRMLSP